MNIPSIQQQVTSQMPSLPAAIPQQDAAAQQQAPAQAAPSNNIQDLVSISKQAQSLASGERNETSAVENGESASMQVLEGEAAAPTKSVNLVA